MFTNVTQAYDLTDATWEIVLMLTVAFMLGWFFRYLWSTRTLDIISTRTPERPERFRNYSADDLKIVEGIGPKIEELLKKNNITTWEELATTPIEHLRSILQSGGERFQMHDPSSWPDQVALALENRWQELQEFQTLMSGGRIR